MRIRTIALGAACSIALAVPALAESPDLSGDFTLQGRDSKLGDYSGKLTLHRQPAGDYAISVDATTKTGSKITWSGTAQPYGATVLFVKLGLTTEGIAGALTGASTSSESCSGWYTVSNGGKTIKGWWKSSDGSHRSNEQATRGDAAPPTTSADLVDLVLGGKETKEQCLETDLGVAGENAPLALKVKAVKNAPADAKIALESSPRVALFADAAKKTRVTSPLPNADATLYVSGISPSDPGVGETISAKLVSGSNTLFTDKVTAHVARNAFHLAGHGSGGASEMNGWLDGARRDARTVPSFVEGKDEKTQKRVFWSVWVFQDEAGAKLAMSTENAVVSYDGHSNFGMGFAFQTGFTRIAQFFNIADPQVPVNWQYLREHQEHPDLMIQDSEYADDASTSEFSDPLRVAKTVKGKLGGYDTARYPVSGSGDHVHLTRGAQKWLDHHYGDEDNWRIVIKAGSADMPQKKWSRIYLHSCYSGQYYSDSFGGKGTLFFTHDEAQAWSSALPAFIRSCVEGKNDDQILQAINKEENLNDYIRFN